MTARSRAILYDYFQNGAQPTEDEFADLIDSFLLIGGDTITGALILNADPTTALGAATKQYADSLVVGLWDDRGNHNASGNTFPSSGGSGTAGAILKGDIWTVSVAGTLGGVAVNAGDTVRALVDSPGTTSSNWALGENNLGYTPITNVLNSANILVGNGSNVATAVAMSGDVTISNSGVTAIGSSKVTNAMLAGSIAASKLIGTDIATVGTITTGTWQGSSISDSYLSIAAATVTAKVLTGYSVGSNAVLASTDTILAAFGKVQAQINAITGASGVTGSGTSGRLAFWSSGSAITSDANFLFATTKGGTLSVGTTATTANFNLGATALSSGVNPLAVFTGAGATGITTTAENNLILFDLNQTYAWASGVVAMERAFLIKAPTLTATSGITTAATFAIDKAPIATGGTTITNNFALLVQQDNSAFLGNVFFGAAVSIPTALGDFDTSTTSRASLRIRQAALANRPTTPKTGDLYHLDDNSFVFNTGNSTDVLAARLTGTFYTQVGTRPTTLSNTVTETSFIGTASTVSTNVLPANFLTVGKVIKIYAQGTVQTNSAPTLTINIKLGSTIVATTGATSMPNYAAGVHAWSLTVYITCISVGSSGSIRGGGIWLVGAGNAVIQDFIPNGGAGTDTTISTTTSQTITLTAKWGTAATSSKFDCDQIILQHL
jgi:hypothetical protein